MNWPPGNMKPALWPIQNVQTCCCQLDIGDVAMDIDIGFFMFPFLYLIYHTYASSWSKCLTVPFYLLHLMLTRLMCLIRFIHLIHLIHPSCPSSPMHPLPLHLVHSKVVLIGVLILGIKSSNGFGMGFSLLIFAQGVM